jgi:polyisoprenoid-binding protein YceI
MSVIGIVARAACAATAATLLLAAPAGAASFKIDPEHFSVGFLVSHIGYAKVLGLFREASGSFTYDETTKELSNVRIVAKTASVFTNHGKRDDHLRSPDFLNAREFPEMVFVGRKAEATSERTGKLTGELTLIGKTLPLTLDLTVNKVDTYPFASGGLFSRPNYVIGISARGSFKRGAYGISYGVDNGWVGDDVELIIEFEAIRQ